MNNVAVITARNEEATIFPLVKALIGMGFVVLVCDDASTDRTRRMSEEAGAHVIHNARRMGIRCSLVRLWWHAVNMYGAKTVVQLDAGGSHNPADAAGLVARISLGFDFGGDVAIGSRFCPYGHYYGGSWWRKMGSRVMSGLCNWAMRTRITDWSSGYRAFSLKAIRCLSNRTYFARGHAWQLETLAFAVQEGLNVVDFPISYAAGESSLRFSGVLEALNVYLMILFNQTGVRAKSGDTPAQGRGR